MKNRKWKRKIEYVKKEPPIAVPIQRDDRLSAIVPIDRICVEGQEEIERNELFFELCDSVKRNGVLQPLLLRRICDEDSSFGGVYLLVAGKRRLEAARMAGHRAVPSYIVTMDAREAAVTAFLTDCNRVEKNMFEQSDAIWEMKKRFGMTESEIAARIGKSETYVMGKMLLRHFSKEDREFIIAKKFSEDMALILLQIRDQERRAIIMREIWQKKKEFPF